MNKKAQTSIFEGTLVLFLLVICGYALFSFIGLDKRAESSIIASTKAVDMYSEKTKEAFYLEESVKLAAREAFYEIARKGAVENAECKQYKEYFIWESGCMPSNSQFASLFKNAIENYTERKFESTFENDNLIVNFEDSTMNISEKNNFMFYNINYTFNPLFVLDLKDEGIDLDFENIYSSVMEKLGECRQMKNTETCMNEFKADGWETSVSSESGYILFDLNSEKLFFVNGKLQQITLKFALSV